MCVCVCLLGLSDQGSRLVGPDLQNRTSFALLASSSLIRGRVFRQLLHCGHFGGVLRAARHASPQLCCIAVAFADRECLLIGLRV